MGDQPTTRSTDDLKSEEQLAQERAARFGVIDEMRAAFKDVPTEEIEREATRTLAEAGAERRTSD